MVESSKAQGCQNKVKIKAKTIQMHRLLSGHKDTFIIYAFFSTSDAFPDAAGPHLLPLELLPLTAWRGISSVVIPTIVWNSLIIECFDLGKSNSLMRGFAMTFKQDFDSFSEVQLVNREHIHVCLCGQ